MYEIRFLAMSEQDFATYATPSGILTYVEIVTIFQKFNGLNMVNLKWKNHGKKQLPRPQALGISRFALASIVIKGALKWGYDDEKSDTLSMIVNKAVNFHGVRLFGRIGGSQYGVKFTVKDKSVTGIYTSEQDEHGVWGYDVMLNTPISFLPSEEFTITTAIKGPPSQCGFKGKPSITLKDIVVTFKHQPFNLSSNGTNKDMGQVYKLYLSSL